MESSFWTVKSEERERFESYAHAKEALFGHIEVFYNQRRRHSTLGSAQRSSNDKQLTQRN
jgi:transposase InsO family protein